MLVYKNAISKKGFAYKAIYYQFNSGKVYRLTGIPYKIANSIVTKLNLVCIGEETK